MSIANEITRIKGKVADSFTACGAKGATIPESEVIANLPTCIASISTGGGGGIGLPSLGTLTGTAKENLSKGDSLMFKRFNQSTDVVVPSSELDIVTIYDGCYFNGKYWFTVISDKDLLVYTYDDTNGCVLFQTITVASNLYINYAYITGSTKLYIVYQTYYSTTYAKTGIHITVVLNAAQTSFGANSSHSYFSGDNYLYLSTYNKTIETTYQGVKYFFNSSSDNYGYLHCFLLNKTTGVTKYKKNFLVSSKQYNSVYINTMIKKADGFNISPYTAGTVGNKVFHLSYGLDITSYDFPATVPVSLFFGSISPEWSLNTRSTGLVEYKDERKTPTVLYKKPIRRQTDTSYSDRRKAVFCNENEAIIENTELYVILLNHATLDVVQVNRTVVDSTTSIFIANTDDEMLLIYKDTDANIHFCKQEQNVWLKNDGVTLGDAYGTAAETITAGSSAAIDVQMNPSGLLLTELEV